MTTRDDLARTTLGVFFMVGLAAAALWIFAPFIPALVWATMIVVATWPLMIAIQNRLWQRRWLAVAGMTLALLLVLIVPLSVAVTVVVSHVDDIGDWARQIPNLKLPAAPEWLATLPFAGPKLAARWSELAAAEPEAVARAIEPYARTSARWLLQQIGSVGLVVVQFLLTVILCAILYANGEQAAAGVRAFFRRLAGAHGENVVTLAGQAIRGVALGVIVTALVQSVLGGLGFMVAGVPFWGFLTAIMFLLAVAQIGPGPVLVGGVIWAYWTSDSVWMPTALLVWSIFVGALDNILRPILIKRGGDLPLLIVFAGVIGGLLTLGLIGIFVGPVVLAVTYTLLEAWIDDGLGKAEG